MYFNQIGSTCKSKNKTDTIPTFNKDFVFPAQRFDQ